jgi:hypothetical protein
MSQTLVEFTDSNKPYNYFSFSNTTHELVIDMMGMTLSLHPHVDKFNGRAETNLIFIRKSIKFPQYRIIQLSDEKIVYIYHEDSEIIKFNYANYFQIKRAALSDVYINLG